MSKLLNAADRHLFTCAMPLENLCRVSYKHTAHTLTTDEQASKCNNNTNDKSLVGNVKKAHPFAAIALNETISMCAYIAGCELRMTEWKYLISTYNNMLSVHSSTFCSSHYLIPHMMIQDCFKKYMPLIVHVYSSILIGHFTFIATSYRWESQTINPSPFAWK